MSSFSDLFGEFKSELSLMRDGILFAQASYKGIGGLLEAQAKAPTPWPADAMAAVGALVSPNRKAENLTYDGAVVLLSATYETYARDTIEAICRGIEKKIPRFDDLAEKIKSENARATGRVLSRHNDKRFSQFDYVDLSKGLGTCVSGNESYRLNSGPLSSHERNLSSQELAELFKRVGLDRLWERIGASTPIQQHFVATESQVAQKTAMTRLDEFVLLRNQVAHTGSGETATGPDALVQWLDFLLALSESLSSVAEAYCDGLVPAATPAAPAAQTAGPVPQSVPLAPISTLPASPPSAAASPRLDERAADRSRGDLA